MRELFAVELLGGERSNNATAWPLVKEWAARHVTDDAKDGGADYGVETAPSGAVALTLRQPHEPDPSLRWRADVAVGPPGQVLHATVRVRLEAIAGRVVAPVSYEFGSPAIVRTILRECKVIDAGAVVSPEPVELGHSDIDGLVRFLRERERRLPVVVVTRTREAGTTLVDERVLAAQLAGLAHVRVLASEHAAWRLTDVVGSALSVWDGGVRVYFPEFSTADDRYSHRLYVADRVDARLVTQVRSWLATVSSSRTPEHSVHAELREDRRRRLREATESADAEFLLEEAARLEEELGERDVQIAELREEVAALSNQNETLQANVEALSRADADRAAAEAPEAFAPPCNEPRTVSEAVAAVEQLAATTWYAARVTVTAQALKAARDFSEYRQPEELLRAAQAVLEAGALYHDDRLGEPPAEFFARRGYGYGTQPENHLKVDEGTSPDQCLRIYWDENPDTRTWTITHIGRHK